jgi:hypothetical protein
MLQFVFAPLLRQVGGWVRAAGYFAGSLITLLSLFPLLGGLAILVRGRRTA